MTITALADRTQFIFPEHHRQKHLLTKTSCDRRTVRTLGVDCVPFKLSAHTEPTLVLSNFKVSGADRPPNRAGPSAQQVLQPPETQVSLTRFTKEGRRPPTGI